MNSGTKSHEITMFEGQTSQNPVKSHYLKLKTIKSMNKSRSIPLNLIES